MLSSPKLVPPSGISLYSMPLSGEAAVLLPGRVLISITTICTGYPGDFPCSMIGFGDLIYLEAGVCLSLLIG